MMSVMYMCVFGETVFVSVFQAAVKMYDEVMHNLEFAKELHETLDGLTQNVSV